MNKTSLVQKVTLSKEFIDNLETELKQIGYLKPIVKDDEDFSFKDNLNTIPLDTNKFNERDFSFYPLPQENTITLYWKTTNNSKLYVC